MPRIAADRRLHRFLSATGCSIPTGARASPFRRDNTLAMSMAFQGLNESRRRISGGPSSMGRRIAAGVALARAPVIGACRAQLVGRRVSARAHLPGDVTLDDRPGAPRQHLVGGRCRAGGLFPAWLRVRLAARVAAADQQEAWPMRCSPPAGIGAWNCTSTRASPARPPRRSRPRAILPTNPAVLDAFALAIIAGFGPPAYPGLPGHDPIWRPRAERASDRRGDGGTAEAGAGCRLVCVGEQFLRARLAALRSGGRITRGCGRSRRNTIRTACSSCITASAARTGAPTGSRGASRPALAC